MSLGPFFLGFMFLFDSQIVLQNDGIIHGVIDIFPDFIGWLIFIYAIRKNSGKTDKFAGLENICVFPLLISALNFICGIFLFDSMYYENGMPRPAAVFCEIMIMIFEFIFAFRLFGIMSEITFGKKETPKLSKAFRFAEIFMIFETVIAMAALIISSFFSFLDFSGMLNMVSYLLRVSYIWYAVIILFRTAIKLGD